MLSFPVARPRSATATRRFLSSTVPTRKALPFFLNTLRAAAQENHERDLKSRGKMLRMLMFGKPGAGKGTLSARLVKKYDILSISTGDLLRQHIKERTEVGRQAEDIVAQGGLLPDEVMLRVVTSKLDLLHNRHWILDGFPRTLGQGELLDTHLKYASQMLPYSAPNLTTSRKQGTPLSLVVNLDVPDQVILSRISDRWVHLPSGRVYNMSYNRPKVDGLDDETGEPLTKRPDDNPEIFARRLDKFYSTTSPLLSYYTTCATKSEPVRNPHQHPHQLSFPVRPPHQLVLKSLSGKTSDEIWPQLDSVLKGTFPNIKERAEVKRRHSLTEAMLVDGRQVAGSQME
ncbi:adenylate kinase [Armillaria luteobubalina]|uniref:Adenylate kinase n=1 Tax=Armillaria luteobubalina TaxID=153913 RepID=A0AA39QKI9_9AGAR|nr:adenylate kinase [Armillaria luteobubalina]